MRARRHLDLPMPLYDYKCTECGARFEVRHSIHDDPEVPCVCGALGSRAVGAPIVIYQGGQDFWHNNTIKSALEASLAEAKAGGIDAEPVGTRWT